MKNSNFDHEERLIKLLAGLKHEPSQDFDERFWKRFQAYKYRRMSYKFGIVLAAFILAFSTAPLFTSDHPVIQITYGEVSVFGTSQKEGTTKPGLRLNPGDRVKTTPSAWAVVEFNGRYRIKIAPDSEISVQKLKSKMRSEKSVFELKKGRVLVSIDEHRKYPLEIRTLNAFAAALGTQFMVQAPLSPQGPSEISVARGTVRAGLLTGGFNSNEESLKLPAGFSAHIGNAAQTEQLEEKSLRALQEQFQFGQANQALLLIGMGPKRLDELLAPCILYLRFEHQSPLAAKLIDIVRVIQNATAHANNESHLAAARELEKISTTQDEVDSMPLLLFCGSYYHYLGKNDEAERVFLKAAETHASSSFRSLALMAAARLMSDVEEKKDEAYQLAKLITREYPQSYESKEAKELVLRWENELRK